jgi:hypothetical protein
LPFLVVLQQLRKSFSRHGVRARARTKTRVCQSIRTDSVKENAEREKKIKINEQTSFLSNAYINNKKKEKVVYNASLFDNKSNLFSRRFDCFVFCRKNHIGSFNVTPTVIHVHVYIHIHRYVGVRMQTFTEKASPRYKINIYLSHASPVCERLVSNRRFSFHSSFSSLNERTNERERSKERERERERQRGREQQRKAKKNLHQFAIRRVLRRLTFQHQHTYKHAQVDSYPNSFSHSLN